jgi:hypothetical protein
MEVTGRIMLGEGALDLTVYEFEELLIPDITKSQPSKILRAFNKLLDRPIKPIFEEVKMKALKLGSYFIGQQEVVSDSGFKYNAGSLEEAKFIIYSQKPNSFLIKIPKQASVIINAIDDYERYLKDLKAKLFEAFFDRTHDHKQADILMQQAFEEVGLLEV